MRPLGIPAYEDKHVFVPKGSLPDSEISEYIEEESTTLPKGKKYEKGPKKLLQTQPDQ
jgi:hypothetical protein